MQLTPPAERYYEHTSLDLLIKQINEHAKNEEHALTRSRIAYSEGQRSSARLTQSSMNRRSDITIVYFAATDVSKHLSDLHSVSHLSLS